MSLLKRTPKSLEERYFQGVRPKLYELHGKHQQSGVRESRTLAEHLDSACQFTLTVSRLANVPEPKRAVLLAATAVHDLNKLEGAKERNVKTLVRDRSFLQEQLERAGVSDLIENDEDLELARKLIERHSGHNVSDGTRFLPEDPNIERWASILRAADLFDLELEEEKLTQKLRKELIHAFNRPCELYRIRVTEDRGYITALLLSACEEVLHQHQYNVLAIFPDGVLVEGPANSNSDLTTKIAAKWEDKIEQVFGGNIEKLVRATKDGIKISSQAVQHNREEVINTVLGLLEKKKAGFKLDKIQGDVDKWSKQNVSPDELQAALDVGLVPVDNAEDFYTSEGMKAAYLSYREVQPKLSPIQVWDKIAAHTGLSEQQRAALDPFDALYGRALFAAKASSNKLAGIIAALQDSLELRKGEASSTEIEVSEEMIAAVQRSLSCPFVKNMAGSSELAAYIEANPRQRCSLGATVSETAALSSDQMPIGTKVQMFSNRLPGGMTSDPVRQADPIASLAYQLMTVGAHLPAAKKEPPYYLHLALPNGSAPALLRIWRDWLQDTAATNAEGGPVTVDELKLYRDRAIEFKANKVVGAALPKRAEFVHSTVTIPIMWGETTASLALLKSLRLALELSLSAEFGFPFILSSGLQVDASVQSFGRIEGISSGLQPLLSLEASQIGVYDRAQASEILKRLRCLTDLAISIVSLSKLDDCVYDLARACAQPFSLYFVLMRWLLREQESPSFALIWSRIREPLHVLLESLMPNENSALTRYLKEATQIAAESRLWGSSAEKRTSLSEPFTEFVTSVRSQKSYMDLEFMFAALVQKYHTRLDRIREHGVGLTKLEQLKSYYAVLRKLYEEVYQGRPDKLLSDQKNLEAAYLFFLEEARRELRAKAEGSKQTEESVA
ncbi:CRISPR-associated protein Csc3 [Leptolyngbya sp. FACHB-261]|uniref:CRISPR-associated protein Csc3 n=1 Tax=Leptolyngbya sp. FACHB-261 TaxID=2692806 RepID=UPI001683F31B|nr:CRISPR-associated protein Csc3 [Leptolyngbya sp. FACHB-261]MBD2102394.1 CRISPR-associated protein Csc3 [Leptolyngbya sp. FACHB-261]